MRWKTDRLGRGRRWMSAVALVVATLGTTAAARQTSSDFVPMTQAPQDTVPGGLLVVAAYAFAWVAVVAYVFVVWRRTRRIEHELSDVRARIGTSHRAG